jgi:hypothetical protein
MKINELANEHGTLTSHHVCDTCKTSFTITPAAPGNGEGYENCLSTECDSYDPHRDVDILFQTDEEIANSDKVVSLKMLQARKNFKKTGKLDVREKP